MPMEDCYKINKEFVVFEHLDGELTVINLHEGHYFLGRGPAIDIFQMLVEAKTVDHLVQQTRALYSVGSDVATTEIEALLNLWLESGLVAKTDEAPQIGPANTPEQATWTEPVFIAFDDMRDLLLLDPIHEADIDNQGWPVSKA